MNFELKDGIIVAFLVAGLGGLGWFIADKFGAISNSLTKIFDRLEERPTVAQVDAQVDSKILNHLHQDHTHA